MLKNKFILIIILVGDQSKYFYYTNTYTYFIFKQYLKLNCQYLQIQILYLF